MSRVEAFDFDRVRLTELITERTVDVVLSDRSEWRAPMWLARVLPPPDDSTTDSALLATPYELRADETAWRAYFERVLSGVPEAKRNAALAQHCKARRTAAQRPW